MAKPRRRMDLICANPTCGKTFSRVAKDVTDPEHSYCSHQCAPGRPKGSGPGVRIVYLTCFQCKKLFVRRAKSVTKDAAHTVCSNTCRDLMRRTHPLTVRCEGCGIMFKPNSSNFDANEHHYCTKSCFEQFRGERALLAAETDPARLTLLKKNRASRYAWHKGHRALKRGATVNDFTAAQWEAMLQAHGSRCVYCGIKSSRLTQDHLTPLSKGGNHTQTNILPACQSCNSRKNAGAVLKPVQPILL